MSGNYTWYRTGLSAWSLGIDATLIGLQMMKIASRETGGEAETGRMMREAPPASGLKGGEAGRIIRDTPEKLDPKPKSSLAHEAGRPASKPRRKAGADRRPRNLTRPVSGKGKSTRTATTAPVTTTRRRKRA